MIDGLIFLLHSSLFLYAVAPRLRLAIRGHHVGDLAATYTPTAPTMDVHHLVVTTVYNNNSWTTQLRFGDAVLIEARALNVERVKGCEVSLKWFCEEVEFLNCEYRARENEAAETMGCVVTENVKSRVVKLKLGKGVFTKRNKKPGGVRKEEGLRMKLVLKKTSLTRDVTTRDWKASMEAISFAIFSIEKLRRHLPSETSTPYPTFGIITPARADHS